MVCGEIKSKVERFVTAKLASSFAKQRVLNKSIVMPVDPKVPDNVLRSEALCHITNANCIIKEAHHANQ